jgi:hypothetical protein
MSPSGDSPPTNRHCEFDHPSEWQRRTTGLGGPSPDRVCEGQPAERLLEVCPRQMADATGGPERPAVDLVLKHVPATKGEVLTGMI